MTWRIIVIPLLVASVWGCATSRPGLVGKLEPVESTDAETDLLVGRYELGPVLRAYAENGTLDDDRPAELMDQIVVLIRETIDPDHWHAHGGTTGRLTIRGSKIVVTTSAGNHKAIRSLISQLEGASRYTKLDNERDFAAIVEFIRRADSIRLYSIEPLDPFAPRDPLPGEIRFHGYPILGSVYLTSPHRGRVVEDVARDLIVTDLFPGCEFVPRHGLRARRGNATVDLVICYQCGVVHVEGTEIKSATMIGKASRDTLNGVLRDADIRLAPTSSE